MVKKAIPKQKTKTKMKTEGKGQNNCTYFLNYLKLNKNLLYNSLFVALIGVFLLPKIVFASPITVERIIDLTNKEREASDIIALVADGQLTEAANLKAKDVLKTQVFDHNIGKKKFSAWVSEVGYKYSYAGENLAIDFITSESLVGAWMESEGHKKNLLNQNYKDIGVAVVEGNFDGQNTIIVVQIFGARYKNIIPEEISRKNEQLLPCRGEVLSANTNYLAINNLNKKPQTKLSIIDVNFVIAIFSIIITSLTTYLYFLCITYLISLIIIKKP